MTLAALDEAVAAGARQSKACEVLGLDPRTVQRWRAQGTGDDRRAGPHTAPANKLSAAERARLLEIANTPEMRDLSPKQIVPVLADRGEYVASESSFYRVLREEKQLAHRAPSRPPAAKPKAHIATGPNQVWSWDITYLRTAVRGQFYYLYLAVDVWSRKITAHEVHAEESMDRAARLIRRATQAEAIDPDQLVLHADNGSPMKGATMVATLEKLGILPSFSRPRVSNDNPFSEALFRTLKYRPEYPKQPFQSLAEARAWVRAFVAWYNTEHRHSAIRYVTPEQRHSGAALTLLAARQKVYEAARTRRPERWSGASRDWSPPGAVVLNPDETTSLPAPLGRAA